MISGVESETTISTHFDTNQQENLGREWKIRKNSTEDTANGTKDAVDNDGSNDHVFHDFLQGENDLVVITVLKCVAQVGLPASGQCLSPGVKMVADKSYIT